MAEIISRKKGSKKIIPRVDLTPMVDLGFLLITFFIVTTSMKKPTAMKFDTPVEGANATSAASKTLTLILVNSNKIYYYQGTDSLHLNNCTYDAVNGLRKVINQKQLQVEKHFGNKTETVILIKPTHQCSYKNMVDASNEMLINNVKRYMIINANNYEENLSK